MNIKKALFGGYRREAVDQMITQWSEEKESTQSRIEMMEIELGLSNESAKRSVEQLSADIKLKEKSIELLRGELDQKKALAQQLAVVVEEKNAQIADLSAQIEQKERAVKNQEQKTSDLLPSGRPALNDAAYEEGVRRIGQLYVDAKNYTDMIKSDAQIKTNEAVDIFFDEIIKSREEYLAISNQISQKRRAISQLAYEMEGTVKLLRNNLEKFDDKPSISDDPYARLDEIKETLKAKINNGFNPYSVEQEETIPNITPELNETIDSFTDSSRSDEIENNESKADNEELNNRLAEFATQIEELRSVLQMQQEIIDNNKKIQEQRNISENDQSEHKEQVALVSDDNINATKPIVEDTPVEEPVSSERIIPEPRRIQNTELEEHELRSERERMEREKYRLYFSEIEKKYKRDTAAGHRYTFSNPRTTETNGNASSSESTDNLLDTDNKPDAAENKNSKTSVSGDARSTHGKKPSIKEILDKYANLK